MASAFGHAFIALLFLCFFSACLESEKGNSNDSLNPPMAQTNDWVKAYVEDIQHLVKKGTCKELIFPDMSFCGGLVKGYFLRDSLVFIHAIFRPELGYNVRDVYWKGDSIVKISFRRHAAEWDKYHEKYPDEKFEFDTSKMTYSDVKYEFLFDTSITATKTSHLKDKISFKIDIAPEGELLDKLIQCAHEMKNELLSVKKNVKVKAWLDLSKIQHRTLAKWLNYYGINSLGTDMIKFAPLKVDSIRRIPGMVFGSFNKEFNKLYKPFLVYSDDAAKYVDFDSYSWNLSVIDGERKVVTSPDQEVNLVDIEKKRVERIAFHGPGQWTEDAFWLGDTLVCLEYSSYFNKPCITIFDLKNNVYQYWEYEEEIEKSDYWSRRMKEHGILDEWME